MDKGQQVIDKAALLPGLREISRAGQRKVGAGTGLASPGAGAGAGLVGRARGNRGKPAVKNYFQGSQEMAAG